MSHATFGPYFYLNIILIFLTFRVNCAPCILPGNPGMREGNGAGAEQD